MATGGGRQLTVRYNSPDHVITIAGLFILRRHEAAHRNHRPRTFCLSVDTHRWKPGGLLRAQRLQPVRVRPRIESPSDHHRASPALRFPDSYLQDSEDVSRKSSREAGEVRTESFGGIH